jgi:hypothetical protein
LSFTFIYYYSFHRFRTLPGDTTIESNENLVLTLSNAVGAAITKGTATGTIVDDDTVSSIVYTGTSGNDTLRGNSAAPPTPVLDELFQGLAMIVYLVTMAKIPLTVAQGLIVSMV